MPNKPRLTIRLSDEDTEALRALAKRARLTVSDLIRQWIRLGELPVRESGRPPPESLLDQLEATEGMANGRDS